MTTLDPETFTRAVEIDGHQRLCRHEAGHATAGLLLGLDVRSVRAGFHTLADLEHANLDEAAGEAIIRSSPHAREFAIAILCGPMCEPRRHWPPPMIVAKQVPSTPDERQISEYIRAVDLDEAGYTALCDEARALTESAAFKGLHASMVDALTEPPHSIGRAQLRHFKTIVQEKHMQRMTKAATATATDDDAGIFEAIVATWDLDRDNDIIERGAFAKTISEWREVGRMVPLHWNHGSDPDDIIGEIDPREMEETSDGLRVTGHVDLETERGRGAWRLMKRNTVAFSFGYLTTHSHEDHKGTRRITGLDIFEVSAVPAPANNRTRLVSTKAVNDSADDMHTIVTQALARAVGEVDRGHHPATTETLRQKATRIERELAPITIASFDA